MWCTWTLISSCLSAIKKCYFIDFRNIRNNKILFKCFWFSVLWRKCISLDLTCFLSVCGWLAASCYHPAVYGHPREPVVHGWTGPPYPGCVSAVLRAAALIDLPAVKHSAKPNPSPPGSDSIFAHMFRGIQSVNIHQTWWRWVFFLSFSKMVLNGHCFFIFFFCSACMCTFL